MKIAPSRRAAGAASQDSFPKLWFLSPACPACIQTTLAAEKQGRERTNSWKQKEQDEFAAVEAPAGSAGSGQCWLLPGPLGPGASPFTHRMGSSPWEVTGNRVPAPGFASPSSEVLSWSPGARLLGCLSTLSPAPSPVTERWGRDPFAHPHRSRSLSFPLLLPAPSFAILPCFCSASPAHKSHHRERQAGLTEDISNKSDKRRDTMAAENGRGL